MFYLIACISIGYKFDVAPESSQDVSDMWECIEFCELEAACFFWHYKYNTCYFLPQAAETATISPDNLYISGPKVCEFAGESFSRLQLNQYQFNTCIQFYFYKKGCYRKEWTYSIDAFHEESSFSPMSCQLKCLNEDMCSYWSLNEKTNICYLFER